MDKKSYGWTEVLTKRFKLGSFYVRKVANKAKSTQQVPFNFNGITLIYSLLTPLICKCGTSFVDLLCFFCLVFAMPLCASVYMCLVVTCWESVT